MLIGNVIDEVSKSFVEGR